MGYLKLLGYVVVLAACAGIVFVGYETLEASAAEDFDQSLGQVVNQVDRMESALVETGEYVADEIAQLDVRYVTDIEQLVNQWKPRYYRAIDAFNRFSASIDAATVLSAAYFEAQSLLTERFNSRARRAEARIEDAAEYERYLEWEAEAQSKLELALAIMLRMEDMDIDIEKMRLASELSPEIAKFSSVPDEILELSRELARFQIASRNVRASVGTAF